MVTKIQEILKTAGISARLGSDEELKIKWIKTGIPMLDILFGGGIPRRRITMLGGEASVGKSWTILKAISSAQKQGLNVALIDTETKFDPRWAKRVGIDLDKLVVVQSPIAETAFEAVISMAGENVDLICVDSIGGMIPGAENEENMEKNFTALFPRVVSKGLRKLAPVLEASQSAILFSNQVRSTMVSTPGGPILAYPGGRSLTHACSIIARYRRGQWISDNVIENKVSGFFLKVMTEKNVLSPPRGEIEFPFRFDIANVDLVAACVASSIDAGIVTKKGMMYYYKDNSFRGMNKLISYVRDNNSVFSKMKSKVWK